jgi:hypothetical protein
MAPSDNEANTQDEATTQDETSFSHLPPSFFEARESLRSAIAKASGHWPADTVLAALITETIPRLVAAYGPIATAQLLQHLADNIAAGLAPNCTRQ